MIVTISGPRAKRNLHMLAVQAAIIAAGGEIGLITLGNRILNLRMAWSSIDIKPTFLAKLIPYDKSLFSDPEQAEEFQRHQIATRMI